MFNLSLQGLDLLMLVLLAHRPLLFGVARRDMLRAVPVESFDVEQEGTLNLRLVTNWYQQLLQVGALGDIEDLGLCGDLQSLLLGVIHQKQRGALVVPQIAGADVLEVPLEVGVSEGCLVQHLEKALWAAAELNIWPTGVIDSGHIETVALTDELGFDGAINYRTQDVSAALSEFCPDGIDVYFDNVGGEISDSVLQQMNEGGRISVCGQISQYNLADPETGPRLTWLFIVKRLMMRGFLVFDHSHRYIEALREMATWLADGRLQYREDVIDGLENAPAAFIGMLQGDNTGKRLVRLAT